MLAQNRHGDVNNDVGVQRNSDGLVADDLQRALRQAHLRLLHREALLGQGFGDVMVRDGTEQTAIDAGLLRDLNGQAGQLFALGLGFGQLAGGDFFQLGALGFEFGDGRGRGAAGLALRDQEIQYSIFNS